MRIRDLGFTPGILPPGDTNSIIDISGVGVGHATIADGEVQSGVTALLPHRGNLFREKVPAAVHVINGFGKSAGLMQIAELGSIETPILLTNTFGVGTASQALIRMMLRDNPEIGRTTGSVNPVVCECFDGYLNDIRSFPVKEEHCFEALRRAAEDAGPPEEGAVGAGRGMSCYELKGGIGTSSRRLCCGAASYTLASLVLTNFGKLEELVVCGRMLGREISGSGVLSPGGGQDHGGSVIVILATDAPLLPRQLGRLARRAVAGLSRTGSIIAGGSGELVIAFSTARRIEHFPSRDVHSMSMLDETLLDVLFAGAVESVEESVLNSLAAAVSVRGMDDHVRHSLAELMAEGKLN